MKIFKNFDYIMEEMEELCKDSIGEDIISLTLYLTGGQILTLKDINIYLENGYLKGTGANKSIMVRYMHIESYVLNTQEVIL